MTTLRRLALCLALLSFLGGCGSTGDSTAAGPPGRRVSPLPSVELGELPEGCRPGQVEDLFNHFLRAVAGRDREGLLEDIAPPRELNWFGVSKPEGAVRRLESPRAVAVYFLGRARSGESWTLRRAQISPVVNPPATGPYARPQKGPGSEDEIVAASFQLVLRDEGEQPDPRGGKAGIDCTTQEFYVWNGG